MTTTRTGRLRKFHRLVATALEQIDPELYAKLADRANGIIDDDNYRPDAKVSTRGLGVVHAASETLNALVKSRTTPISPDNQFIKLGTKG